jgi:hypothetical protein
MNWPDTISTDYDDPYNESKPAFKRRYAWSLLAITVAPWLIVALIVHVVFRWLP